MRTFGQLLGNTPMSLQETANELTAQGFEITRERVRQIENQALEKVKRRLSSRFDVNSLDDICD